MKISYAVKEAAKLKLQTISDTLSVKSYAWHEKVSSDIPSHGNKSEFWRTLAIVLKQEGCGQCNITGINAQPQFLSFIPTS